MEMDPWVVAEVLDPNLKATDFQSQAVIHTSPVETLLAKVAEHGGTFIITGFLAIHLTRADTFTTVCAPWSKHVGTFVSAVGILGGKFDYISVTPPYEAVVFSTLMQQLSESPLLKDDTCIVSITSI